MRKNPAGPSSVVWCVLGCAGLGVVRCCCCWVPLCLVVVVPLMGACMCALRDP